MNYLPFINGGRTLYKKSLLTSFTICIESCGTGDISSSITVIAATQAIFKSKNFEKSAKIVYIVKSNDHLLFNGRVCFKPHL